ncbi:hypothetical protein [Aliivibrio logei]|uniref:Uncharacterized protein n=2 Tax=Aliivibrio logei TaxID=688 RepID=A0A1B9P018_ALILO|nr:hypothetical protein [Aliivibrio logei]OCH21698.1 hypothetical protein A6E04_07485 [Aliivibrio logei]OEF12648.1 hypothetical protein A1Q5_09210 [Aliivibrio logei 5S-186]
MKKLEKAIEVIKYLPFYMLFAPFWFSNGVVDKFYGILFGTSHGDSWEGWKEYIAGTWAKKPLTDALFVPMFDYLFPVLVILQIVPVILLIASFLKLEILPNKPKTLLKAGLLSSLFVTSSMAVSQTLAGASDVQYLFQFWAVSLLAFWYVETQAKSMDLVIA